MHVTQSWSTLYKGYLLLALILLTCQNLGAQDPGDVPSDVVVAALHITQGAEGYKIDLTDAVLISSYKPVFKGENSAVAQGDILCQVLDQDHLVQDSLVIRQPLQIRYEYPTDDQTTIGSAVIPVQENSVMIRFRYTPSLKYLRLITLDADRQPEFYTTLTLPEMNH